MTDPLLQSRISPRTRTRELAASGESSPHVAATGTVSVPTGGFGAAITVTVIDDVWKASGAKIAAGALVIGLAGRWRVDARASYPAAAAGNRLLQINGTTVSTTAGFAANASVVSGFVELDVPSAGLAVVFTGWQDSGGALVATLTVSAIRVGE